MLMHKPLEELGTLTNFPSGMATMGMRGVRVFETGEGVSEGTMAQNDFKTSGRLGEFRRSGGHKHNDCRPQTKRTPYF